MAIKLATEYLSGAWRHDDGDLTGGWRSPAGEWESRPRIPRTVVDWSEEAPAAASRGPAAHDARGWSLDGAGALVLAVLLAGLAAAAALSGQETRTTWTARAVDVTPVGSVGVVEIGEIERVGVPVAADDRTLLARRSAP
ncbi:MAG TPA: hypothetical protein VNE58_00505 [Casimicrobiaceae bacterium]|nr:hypothetical protein [Casimicrobiaceae bacterium]